MKFRVLSGKERGKQVVTFLQFCVGECTFTLQLFALLWPTSKIKSVTIFFFCVEEDYFFPPEVPPS